MNNTMSKGDFEKAGKRCRNIESHDPVLMPMQYVICDLEATCWEKGSNIDRMETIEIGAAKLVSPDYDIVDTFSTFVRPVQEPVLSDFCIGLTTIKQSDVDPAPEFPRALALFIDWIGSGNITVCSWGEYDFRQIADDCRKHDMRIPAIFNNHINLKAVFAELYGRKPCGMRKALNILGISHNGVHHRGIDDALNISRIAQEILPFYYGRIDP